MRILQIKSAIVCGPERVGKWYCSDSVKGKDGEPVHRYLQDDGTWCKNTHYFDSEKEINELLSLGIKPDFAIDSQEAVGRQIMRDWQDDDRNDILEDLDYYESQDTSFYY